MRSIFAYRQAKSSNGIVSMFSALLISYKYIYLTPDGNQTTISHYQYTQQRHSYDTPFMTYINSDMFRHHGSILRESL